MYIRYVIGYRPIARVSLLMTQYHSPGSLHLSAPFRNLSVLARADRRTACRHQNKDMMVEAVCRLVAGLRWMESKPITIRASGPTTKEDCTTNTNTDERADERTNERTTGPSLTFVLCPSLPIVFFSARNTRQYNTSRRGNRGVEST